MQGDIQYSAKPPWFGFFLTELKRFSLVYYILLQLIDKRKLGRAQAKALEKASKRELDGHSSKKKSFMLAATASQTPSRRDISSANIMDIHLNNVDINIGAKYLFDFINLY